MAEVPAIPEQDAYSLLSTPTLDLTDAQIEAIILDLRRRREAFVKTGKADKPKAEKKAIAKLDKDEKARNTAILLSQLKIPGMEPKA